MKKLMSIASAMLCVTALASLDPSTTSLSSGVVGYGTLATGTAKYQGVGAFFFNFDGAMSNDLTKITVECVGGDGYMDPWTEYLRQLNPASAGNLACYTYINKAFCDAVGTGGRTTTLGTKRLPLATLSSRLLPVRL